jgi:hypothetical protein
LTSPGASSPAVQLRLSRETSTVEAPVANFGHGHAGALDRNAVPRHDVVESERGSFDGQAHAGVGRPRLEGFDGFDAADGRDYSCKHGIKPVGSLASVPKTRDAP